MYKKFVAFILVLQLAACAIPGLPPEERPKTWAQPVDALGIANLHEITPVFFRSAQPDFEGLVVVNNLQRLSPLQTNAVKTVLSLRSLHSNDRIFHSHNVHYVRAPVETWNINEAEIVQALRIINTPAMQPVLLHCKYGADRTGLVSALYRVLYQGWSKEEAIREMTLGGFGFHSTWSNLIEYINKVDVEDLKNKVEAEGAYPEPEFKY